VVCRRRERLDLLDKRHVGRVYTDAFGGNVDALDYDSKG